MISEQGSAFEPIGANEWSKQPLGGALRSKPQYGLGAAAVRLDDSLPRYLRITDISDDGKYTSDFAVSVKHRMADRYFLTDGDLVVARTGASVGKSYLYSRNDGPLVFAGFLIRLQPDEKKLDPRFLRSFLATSEYWTWVKQTSMRSGQPGVNGNELATLPVPLPKIDEQVAIAEALGDVDSLIEALERLIAKKRDIKQAAMQQLLTGKTRLPGFKAEWQELSVGSFGRCLRGVSYKPETDLFAGDTGQSVRLLRSNNVQESVLTISDIQFVNRSRVSDQQQLQKDDIVVCMANGSKDLVGKSATFAICDGFVYTFGAFMGCFRVQSHSGDAKFLSYLFQSGSYRMQLSVLLAGSSINNLRPSDIEQMTFLVPDIEEQKAIAATIADMDAELDALGIRLTKTRHIKQGMMQQLLTGKVRLI